MVSSDAIHVTNSSCQKTAKSAGKRCGAYEEGETFLRLSTFVPHAHEVEAYYR
jgi:hypothetical protein